MRFIKRVLAFALAACIGLVLAHQWRVLNQPVGEVESVVKTRPEAGVYSYYYEDCRCMFWTSDSKMWVSIEELPKPDFTDEARRNSYSGGVQMRVLLGADGKVAEAIPYGPLPYGLTEEIVSAAKRIRFTPASVFDGKPESVWVTIGYGFQTVPGILRDTYETRVYVLDHYDVSDHGRERRLER
jgi:hypothetical protein